MSSGQYGEGLVQPGELGAGDSSPATYVRRAGAYSVGVFGLFWEEALYDGECNLGAELSDEAEVIVISGLTEPGKTETYRAAIGLTPFSANGLVAVRNTKIFGDLGDYIYEYRSRTKQVTAFLDEEEVAGVTASPGMTMIRLKPNLARTLPEGRIIQGQIKSIRGYRTHQKPLRKNRPSVR